MTATETSTPVTDFVALVEPRVGSTQTRWLAFSSACRPFGMVSLSPDTRINGDWGCGYVRGDSRILGFSHCHDWQVGALLVMPIVGLVDLSAGPEVWASGFPEEDAIVKPGDHRVFLSRYTTTVELTATLRVGVHRYHFPAGADSGIIVDLVSPLGPCKMGQSSLIQITPRRLEGFVINLPTRRRPKPLTIYFALELDWDTTVESQQEAQGRYILRFAADSDPVVLKAAISYTSCQAAWENLRAETERKDFDTIRNEARDEWNSLLGRVEVEGGTAEQRGRLYTDLFFALAGRRTCSDYTGTYIDNTGPESQVRQIPLDTAGHPLYRHFNSDAFWGAQWGITPLWSLLYPEIIREFCSCFLDHYRNGGLIPRGPSGGNDTYVMTSAQSTPLFTSAILQNIVIPEDSKEIYQALRKNHFPGGLMGKAGYEHDSAQGGGIEDYMALGYIPEDLPRVGFHINGAAQTLEHAYNDWCLAQLAEYLGEIEDAAYFRERSRNYRNLFDPEIGFMRPRNRDGSWLSPYSPDEKRGWTEANGWTYTFYAPHDLPDLITCFGSEERFLARLEECLTRSAEGGFFAPHGKHEENTLDFGNEPALAVAHLFHIVGKPERTDYWLRRIYDTLKSGNTPTDGYGGDEDQGIMGAWNVLVALGLFSVTGASGLTPTYQITAPLFDHIILHRNPALDPSDSLIIEALGNHPGATHRVESVTLDGHPLPHHEISYDQFRTGKHLRLVMSTGASISSP